MVVGKVFGGVIRLFVTLFTPNRGRPVPATPRNDPSSDATGPVNAENVQPVAQVSTGDSTRWTVALDSGRGQDAVPSVMAENLLLRRDVSHLRKNFETTRAENMAAKLRAEEWRQKAFMWKAKTHETMKKMDIVRAYMASERVDVMEGIVEQALHFGKLERGVAQANLKVVAAVTRCEDAKADLSLHR